MCEGFWAVTRGSNDLTIGTHWMCDDSTTRAASSFGSVSTETGYTVEYRISLTNTNIPDSLRMNDGQEIGIGIKIYDKKESGGNKNSPATNVITLEAINHDMSGPKKLSNFIVKANPNQE